MAPAWTPNLRVDATRANSVTTGLVPVAYERDR
jgi:hypothetical protein